jgi:enoyl-CoA hydratase/carnithine racemase
LCVGGDAGMIGIARKPNKQASKRATNTIKETKPGFPTLQTFPKVVIDKVIKIVMFSVKQH